jgi:uroporphyrin-III C-methyltransferase
MSEQNVQESTQHEGKEQPKRPNRTFGQRAVYVVIALAAVGILVQQLWTIGLKDSLQRDEVVITQGNSKIAATENTLQQEKRDIDVLRDALLRDRLLLQLDRFEDQMDTGWQIWLITGDSQRLVQAITQAQRWLIQVPGAEADALRMTLTGDLNELRSRPILNLGEATQQLDGVIASIDKLPLQQAHRVESPMTPEVSAVPPSNPDATTLMEKSRAIATELAAEVWQAIRRMIRVQRLDQTEQALLAPEQKIFLQQGVRMLLLDARHALVQRNTALYQQSLQQASLWIGKYFDNTDTLVQHDLSLLIKLSSINIDPSTLRFDQTYRALEQLRRSLIDGTGASEVTSDATEATVMQGSPLKADPVKGDAT